MGLYLGGLIYGTTFALVGLYTGSLIFWKEGRGGREGRGGGEEVLIYRVLWYSVFSFASTIYTEMNKIFNSIMVVKV